jgi:hypothetical protein
LLKRLQWWLEILVYPFLVSRVFCRETLPYLGGTLYPTKSLDRKTVKPSEFTPRPAYNLSGLKWAPPLPNRLTGNSGGEHNGTLQLSIVRLKIEDLRDAETPCP